MTGMKVRSMKSNKVRVGLGDAEDLVGFVFVGAVGAEMPPFLWAVFDSLGLNEEGFGVEAPTTRTFGGSKVS